MQGTVLACEAQCLKRQINLFQNLDIVYLYILLDQKQENTETKNQLRTLTIPDLVIELDPESTFQVSVQWMVVSIRSGAWY